MDTAYAWMTLNNGGADGRNARSVTSTQCISWSQCPSIFCLSFQFATSLDSRSRSQLRAGRESVEHSLLSGRSASSMPRFTSHRKACPEASPPCLMISTQRVHWHHERSPEAKMPFPILQRVSFPKTLTKWVRRGLRARIGGGRFGL